MYRNQEIYFLVHIPRDKTKNLLIQQFFFEEIDVLLYSILFISAINSVAIRDKDESSAFRRVRNLFRNLN